MPHNLFNERFFSFRQPAWHGLGLISEEPVSATDAFSRIGSFDIRLESLQTISGIDANLRAVIRSATPDDPQDRVLGTVGPKYQLLTPLEVCEIWDDSVRSTVETVGVLGKGEKMFFTTRLPSLSISGDDIDNYLLFTNPYSGGEAYSVRITPVRVVCQNTLMMATALSTETMSVRHDSKAQKRLSDWLSGITERAERRSQALRDMFQALSQRQISSVERDQIFSAAYPNPNPVKENSLIPDEEQESRTLQFETNLAYQQLRRTLADELFNGAGSGMDLPTAKGTAWGAYNAVVELEDYSRSRSNETRAYQSLFGFRAQAKERAWVAATNLL